MGKQFSCISRTVPAEHKPPSLALTHKKLNKISTDIEHHNDNKVNTMNKMENAKLLSCGYIGSYIRDLGIGFIDNNIIILCRMYYYNDKPLIRKRCIFMSMMHLNLCIDEIPSYILDEAIFCFKANKTELLFNMFSCDGISSSSSNSSSSSMLAPQSMHNPLILSLSSSTSFSPLFIKYCIEKNNNGLLLLLQDNENWNDISSELSLIDDIFYNKKRKYKALKTDATYWQHQYTQNIHSRFMVKSEDIIHELTGNNLKFYPSMEIIVQSNPTLIAMKSFDFNEYILQNGCHGMTWIHNNKSNKSTPIISIHHDQYAQFIDINEESLIYCVDEEEFILSDTESETITITHENTADLADFDDDDIERN